jgi:hypothetical protein
VVSDGTSILMRGSRKGRSRRLARYVRPGWLGGLNGIGRSAPGGQGRRCQRDGDLSRKTSPTGREPGVGRRRVRWRARRCPRWRRASWTCKTPGWLRQRYELEGLSSYAIAAELGCRATTVSRALRRHGIAARMGRPAVIVPGQVYGRLTVLGELPERTRGGRVFRCCAPAGARPRRGPSSCDRERSAPAAACATRQGRAATAGRRGYRADNATDGSSCCTRQGARAHAPPGCSPVAATAAARPPCAAPTSRAATPARADACSRSTAGAATECAQPPSVSAQYRGPC